VRDGQEMRRTGRSPASALRPHQMGRKQSEQPLVKVRITPARVSGIGGKGVIKRGMSATREGDEQAVDANALVLEIVGEMSGVTDVTPDAELVAELGFDSLGLFELLVALEDALHLKAVDLEAVGKLDRVADLQRVVQESLAQVAIRRSE
jgi:acyl carrier protein